MFDPSDRLDTLCAVAAQPSQSIGELGYCVRTMKTNERGDQRLNSGLQARSLWIKIRFFSSMRWLPIVLFKGTTVLPSTLLRNKSVSLHFGNGKAPHFMKIVMQPKSDAVNSLETLEKSKSWLNLGFRSPKNTTFKCLRTKLLAFKSKAPLPWTPVLIVITIFLMPPMNSAYQILDTFNVFMRFGALPLPRCRKDNLFPKLLERLCRLKSSSKSVSEKIAQSLDP